jgi:hypothetical protein
VKGRRLEAHPQNHPPFLPRHRDRRRRRWGPGRDRRRRRRRSGDRQRSVRPGRAGPRRGSGITDRDPSDPIGRGRGGGSGITDRDPSDPIGRGRGGSRPPTTGVTDRDPTDPIGSGRGGSAQRSGCTDRDPTDPGGDGRNCRPAGGGDVYQTGRRERRYDVCWVDHPSRSDDDCNRQIYSEWQITFSDGHVEYDTAESQRRQAEMVASGYTARWHRMVVNDWITP